MKRAKMILTASLLAGMSALAVNDSAEARHKRGASSDYVVSAAICSPPPPPLTYIYPAPNWEPFFRRHLYRYGPIVICEPSLRATNVISVLN